MGWITDILYDAIEASAEAIEQEKAYQTIEERERYKANLESTLKSARAYVTEHGASQREKYRPIIQLRKQLQDPNKAQCVNCLQIYDKTELKKCKTCGDVLCSNCRPAHKCHLFMGKPKNENAERQAELEREYDDLIETYNNAVYTETNVRGPQDLLSALPNYIEAAKHSFARAQYRIGLLYDEGELVRENPDEAFFWYSEAVKNNSELEKLVAAWMFKYYARSGGAGNLSVIESWYSKIPFAKYDEKLVQTFKEILDLVYYRAGLDYYHGNNIEKSFTRAVHYFDKCETEYDDGTINYELIAQAKFELGREYELGITVCKDMNQAIHWYTESASYRNADACCRLGMLLEEGEFVEGDLTKAVSLYSVAAEQGQSDAQFRLGKVYYEGVAVPKNMVNAKFWIQKAVEADNEDALEFVAEHPDLSVTGVTHVSYQATGDIIQGNVGVLAKDDAIVNRATVSSSADSSILSEIREKQDYKFCMYCGQRLPVEALFCMACGKKL